MLYLAVLPRFLASSFADKERRRRSQTGAAPGEAVSVPLAKRCLRAQLPQGSEQCFELRDLALGFDPLASWQARPQFHVDEPHCLPQLVFGIAMPEMVNADVACDLLDLKRIGHGMVPLVIVPFSRRERGHPSSG